LPSLVGRQPLFDLLLPVEKAPRGSPSYRAAVALIRARKRHGDKSRRACQGGRGRAECDFGHYFSNERR
jgi:hypothetical protein